MQGSNRAATENFRTEREYLQLHTYTPPSWARQLQVPSHRYCLTHLPTPIHSWALPGLPAGVEVCVKRDDLTGMQLSGNKVRKLEFLLAEAKRAGKDSVITLGGIQSNHCRATAVAARYLGLECHLILRNSRQLADQDPGLTGNLLLDRMVGAHIHQVTKEEYTRLGSTPLGQQLEQKLRAEGRNPMVIPVGGSSSLGTWGYIEAMQEITEQAGERPFTDIAMACGSGGTAAGVALGAHLSSMQARVHAFGVCDDPDYFYSYIDDLFQGLGATKEAVGTDARGMLEVHQAKGSGYAMSQPEELETALQVALQTGIVLDPVYSAKAVHGLIHLIQSRPEAWQGRRILFIHTGGLLGMYDKTDQLQPLIEKLGTSHRLALVEQ
ncbi:hypothetical protein WJX84_010812 [Apatococcus fuscideae]|uniref:Tryptophan synthase beta chain-like PALP domain-containing protein n=1 Tax=Apatococcus fuscideae TaxID=2026836 RepID=A0AAW1SKC9_9CHLO